MAIAVHPSNVVVRCPLADAPASEHAVSEVVPEKLVSPAMQSQIDPANEKEHLVRRIATPHDHDDGGGGEGGGGGDGGAGGGDDGDGGDDGGF